MNYQGSAYVPLRFFSEYMGAKVEYNDFNQKINIYANEQYKVKSMINSKQKDNLFELITYSNKREYKENETTDIWSTLNYLDKSSLKITHGSYKISAHVTYKINGQTNTLMNEITIIIK
ncbi:hypothetical protein GK047_20270 [Paenibacillus sp. SYP-B3998]|uniref:Copper amine oxidase-like N-terminal domain-containing protein n=1 Tax=Paenibacillus sp. SYP-B3998 TaxID=2678564 RepID=A0A6G4A3W2_9BACL|nr:stalk domain-containing protein [Paenibacillus sp. SYP-B3998]NEW08337.1 hypothetical protein [Paenibacillus sp. SYP-B3998]